MFNLEKIKENKVSSIILGLIIFIFILGIALPSIPIGNLNQSTQYITINNKEIMFKYIPKGDGYTSIYNLLDNTLNKKFGFLLFANNKKGKIKILQDIKRYFEYDYPYTVKTDPMSSFKNNTIIPRVSSIILYSALSELLNHSSEYLYTDMLDQSISKYFIKILKSSYSKYLQDSKNIDKKDILNYNEWIEEYKDEKWAEMRKYFEQYNESFKISNLYQKLNNAIGNSNLELNYHNLNINRIYKTVCLSYSINNYIQDISKLDLEKFKYFNNKKINFTNFYKKNYLNKIYLEVYYFKNKKDALNLKEDPSFKLNDKNGLLKKFKDSLVISNKTVLYNKINSNDTIKEVISLKRDEISKLYDTQQIKQIDKDLLPKNKSNFKYAIIRLKNKYLKSFNDISLSTDKFRITNDFYKKTPELKKHFNKVTNTFNEEIQKIYKSSDNKFNLNDLKNRVTLNKIHHNSIIRWVNSFSIKEIQTNILEDQFKGYDLFKSGYNEDYNKNIFLRQMISLNDNELYSKIISSKNGIILLQKIGAKNKYNDLNINKDMKDMKNILYKDLLLRDFIKNKKIKININIKNISKLFNI